jgi:hypothetical protein
MKNYIPKNKFDFEAVERLELLSFEKFKSDIPKLLEWLQDMNWPVAHRIAKYLTPHIREMKFELLNILSSDDGMWKYWIVCSLIAQSPNKLGPDLITAIKRIAEQPSKIEIEDGAVNPIISISLIKYPA